MAGDWIKMRGNLWDDPRIARLVDMTDSSEAAVVGALYWLWATADQHTEDGVMPGLSLRQIDRKTGVQGFGAALCAIGWLADHPEGVRIVGFVEHNGASAKKRCQTAKRVAKHGSANALPTEKHEPTNADSVRDALAREREEIEKEKKKTEGTARATRTPPPTRPPNVSEPVWQDFTALRKTKRAPLTATALDGIAAEAAKAGICLDAALAYCCSVGWQGFNAAWYAERQAKAPPGQAETFRERDTRQARERWEQMTGRNHPESGQVVDLKPDFLVIAA